MDDKEKIVENLNMEDLSNIFEIEVEQHIALLENRPPVVFIYSPDGGLVRSAEIVKVTRDGGLIEFKIMLEH